MSDVAATYRVVLVRREQDEPLRTAERVADVLGVDVKPVLARMKGREVTVVDGIDEGHALRVTASLRMRGLEVRYLPMVQDPSSPSQTGRNDAWGSLSDPGIPAGQPEGPRSDRGRPAVPSSESAAAPSGALLSMRKRSDDSPARRTAVSSDVATLSSSVPPSADASDQGGASGRLTRRTGASDAVAGVSDSGALQASGVFRVVRRGNSGEFGAVPRPTTSELSPVPRQTTGQYQVVRPLTGEHSAARPAASPAAVLAERSGARAPDPSSTRVGLPTSTADVAPDEAGPPSVPPGDSGWARIPSVAGIRITPNPSVSDAGFSRNEQAGSRGGFRILPVDAPVRAPGGEHSGEHTAVGESRRIPRRWTTGQSQPVVSEPTNDPLMDSEVDAILQAGLQDSPSANSTEIGQALSDEPRSGPVLLNMADEPAPPPVRQPTRRPTYMDELESIQDSANAERNENGWSPLDSSDLAAGLSRDAAAQVRDRQGSALLRLSDAATAFDGRPNSSVNATVPARGASGRFQTIPGADAGTGRFKPVASGSFERRVSGANRTLEFEDFEQRPETGVGVRSTAGFDTDSLPPISRPHTGHGIQSSSLGSLEDQLADVSSLHDKSATADQAAAVAGRRRRTQANTAARSAAAPVAENERSGGAAWLFGIVVIVGAALVAVAWNINRSSRSDAAIYASAPRFVELREGDARLGCANPAEGNFLCRASAQWYSARFPTLRASDAATASEQCFVRKNEDGSNLHQSVECSFQSATTAEEGVMRISAIHVRTCAVPLTSLEPGAETTCTVSDESTLRVPGRDDPTFRSTTAIWTVRLDQVRESFPTPIGSVPVREYRVTIPGYPPFLWAWSPRAGVFVRQASIGGVASLEVLGLELPSGRQGTITMR